jgi:hypothetical protein
VWLIMSMNTSFWASLPYSCEIKSMFRGNPPLKPGLGRVGIQRGDSARLVDHVLHRVQPRLLPQHISVRH